MENGWTETHFEEDELYDLFYDPSESSNLADSPNHQDLRNSLNQRLHEWMVETLDPILQGPVPAPPGAVVCTPEAIEFDKGPYLPN